MSNWPRTLADDSALMRKLAVHRDGFDSACRHSLVVAPCCGRHVAADAIISLHGLKTEIRGGGFQAKRDHDWACTDGCLHHLLADPSNGWTKSNLLRALGAPAETIRHERARELAHEAMAQAHAKGHGANPGDEYEKALASLPANVRELRGTEAP